MNGQNAQFIQTPNEAARLQRVAEILCDAILRSESNAALNSSCEAERGEFAATKPMPPTLKDSEAERIFRYLALVGEASPIEIRTTLGLSRSSAWRTLRRLVKTNHITGSGQTRRLVYRINSGEPTVETIGLN